MPDSIQYFPGKVLLLCQTKSKKMKEKDPLHVQIGTRIRIARERSGLTQEQLAAVISKSTQYISDLERGVTGAKIATIADICLALNTSADFLILGIDKDHADSVLTKKIRALSPEEKEIAVHVLTYMISLLQIRKKPKPPQA